MSISEERAPVPDASSAGGSLPLGPTGTVTAISETAGSKLAETGAADSGLMAMVGNEGPTAVPTSVSTDVFSSEESVPEDLLRDTAQSLPEPAEPVHGFLEFLDAMPGATASAAAGAGTVNSIGPTRTPVTGSGMASPGRAPIRRPGWSFLLAHPAHWFALGFGSGLPWVAPGTFGTLFGWASFVVCMPHFSDAQYALAIALGFLVGIWACGVTGRNLGVSDHGSIVWDEIVAIWLVLWLVPKTPWDQAFAFALFRLIDITKPQPIRYFDAKWKNGFGVMFDDLLAAFFTLLLFAAYYRVVGLPA